MEKNKKEPVIKDPKEIRKALEVLFASNFIDPRRMHWENFLRGIFFGAGTVIGATVFIAIIVWFLSIFDNVPVVGPLFDNTKETIQQKNSH